MDVIEDANNAFDSLLAAAESLSTTNHASTPSVTPTPSPGEKNIGSETTATTVPFALKINFNAIHKQLAALQKQEYNGISSGIFLSFNMQ